MLAEQNETETPAPNAEGEGSPEEQAPKKSNKMLFIIIGVVVLLLVVGGFVVWKFVLHKEEGEQKKEEVEEVFDPAKAGKLELAEMLVNLRSIKPKGNMLRVSINLELMKKEDEAKIKESESLIIDQCLTFLREQSAIDIEGGGIERVRQELLIRINNLIKPIKVNRLMFKNFFVQ